MPIYEYKCTKCGKVFEVMQKITDEPIKTCPECGAPVEKIISNSSFVVKGSGWYVTDYAKKNSTASSDNSSQKTSDSASGSK